MPEHIIHTVGKLPDFTLVALINAVHEKMGGISRRFMYGPISIEPNNIQEVIGKHEGYSLDEGYVETGEHKFRVFYRRGMSAINQNGAVDIHSRVASPYFDQIIILPNTKAAPTTADCLLLETILSDFTKLHIPKAAVSGAEGSIQILETEISGLASLHRQMLADAESQRKKLEEDYQNKQAALESATRERQQKFDQTVAEENSKIKSLREALDDAKKTIDDRNHMHVRRELRETISRNIAERVSKSLVPARSQVLSWVVFLLSLVCSAAAAYFAYLNFDGFHTLITAPRLYASGPISGGEIPNFTLLSSMLLIRGTFASIVSLGFLVYAIAWMRKTYLDNVKVSNDLQRYALDINRASWTIETIMEMTSKEGRVLPEKWIEGVCHGLFENQEKMKGEVTPLQALAALLNVSGKAEFGPEGPKFELGKSQARKTARGLEN